MSIRLEFAADEQPPFAFCESIAASGASPWHIRQIPHGESLKFGGGITTSSLCGRVARGWDLRVRITETHLGHACSGCAERYRARFAADGA